MKTTTDADGRTHAYTVDEDADGTRYFHGWMVSDNGETTERGPFARRMIEVVDDLEPSQGWRWQPDAQPDIHRWIRWGGHVKDQRTGCPLGIGNLLDDYPER